MGNDNKHAFQHLNNKSVTVGNRLFKVYYQSDIPKELYTFYYQLPVDTIKIESNVVFVVPLLDFHAIANLLCNVSHSRRFILPGWVSWRIYCGNWKNNQMDNIDNSIHLWMLIRLWRHDINNGDMRDRVTNCTSYLIAIVSIFCLNITSIHTCCCDGCHEPLFGVSVFCWELPSFFRGYGIFYLMPVVSPVRLFCFAFSQREYITNYGRKKTTPFRKRKWCRQQLFYEKRKENWFTFSLSKYKRTNTANTGKEIVLTSCETYMTNNLSFVDLLLYLKILWYDKVLLYKHEHYNT